jgi:hypothetical protein
MIELKHETDLIPECYTGMLHHRDEVGIVYFCAIDGLAVSFYGEAGSNEVLADPVEFTTNWYKEGYYVDLEMSSKNQRLSFLWARFKDHPVLSKELAALILGNTNESK